MPSYFYERDGDITSEAPPATSKVGEIGIEETIKRLTEMLYHLNDIEDVQIAVAAAAEKQKLAAEQAVEEEELFEDDEEAFEDEDEEFLEEDEEEE